MIEVTARLGDGTAHVAMTGHDHDPTSRVCAAVSAVLHTALLGIEHIAAIHPDQVSVTITEETSP